MFPKTKEKTDFKEKTVFALAWLCTLWGPKQNHKLEIWGFSTTVTRRKHWQSGNGHKGEFSCSETIGPPVPSTARPVKDSASTLRRRKLLQGNTEVRHLCAMWPSNPANNGSATFRNKRQLDWLHQKTTKIVQIQLVYRKTPIFTGHLHVKANRA